MHSWPPMTADQYWPIGYMNIKKHTFAVLPLDLVGAFLAGAFLAAVFALDTGAAPVAACEQNYNELLN